MFDLKKAALNDKEFIDSTWEKIDKKLAVVAQRSKNKIPKIAIDGVHDDNSTEEKILDWTNGFWPGLMWLMYYGTKDERYMEVAKYGEECLDKALEKFSGLHHDVGFMWMISSGASYRITGDKRSYNRTLTAASALASRYNLKGEYLRAHPNWSEKDEISGKVIIDCMLNLPLLYWASGVERDPRFKFIAMKHADTAMKNQVRPDGSVTHIAYYNSETGEFLETRGGQGYDANSSWSRGQAWALYGFVLSYIHTGKQDYLDTAKRVAHYFIASVCDDFMPRADFRAPEEPVMYDSSAGAIAACGLLEIARNVPEFEGKLYYNAALKLLKAIDENFCNYDLDNDAIVYMGTGMWRANGEEAPDVHVPFIWNDYYFAEAIYKLKGFDLLLW